MHDHLESIDLPALRTYWLALASHVYGRNHIAARQLATSFEEAETGLRWTAAFMDFRRAGEDLPAQELPDIQPLLQAAQRPGAWLDAADLLAVVQVLQALRDYRQALLRAEPETLIQQLASRFDLPTNLAERLRQSLDEDGQIKDQASTELARVRRQIQATRREIRRILQGLLGRGDLAEAWQEQLITLRAERYVLPVRTSHKGRVRGIVHDRSASGETLFVEPLDTIELNNQLIAQQQEERVELIRILQDLTALLGESAPLLEARLADIAQLDGLRAGALLGERYRGELPELAPQPAFALRELRHPLLCLQLGVEQVVPTDLSLGEHKRQLIITGPNTGGKTVLLKSVGLIHAMSYLGLPVPARGRCGWFPRILTVIGDEQSIALNLSTFSAQLLRLREALDHASQDSLVLLDELGSGTDPREGGALGTAITEALRDRGSLSLVTTHLDALKHYALRESATEIASMRFDVEALRPTYQLQLGISGESHAIDIAQRLNLPDSITRRARVLLQEQESEAERLVRERDQILNQAEAARQDAQSALSAAENQRRQAEQDAEQAAAERDRAYEETLREWNQTLQEARSQVNSRIRQLKHGRDTAGANETLKQMDKQFQRPARPASPQTKRQPQAGDSGIFHPYRLPATVLQVDEAHDRIQVDVRGKQLWGRLAQFEPRAGAQNQTPKPVAASVSLPAADPVLQLDLRGQRREQALQNLLNYLDDANTHGLRQISILHGTGNGVLAEMVRDLLRQDPRVLRFGLARPEQGGAGVTEVELQ
ncbi:endonuclease MutS2 [Thermithiobacillus plumbiphilus]|uniref:Endonuclease MutS2 n=1 Tax=Thermithiobacillus plumbiphilus TaxID=1729899 RepID=A0ABU9DB07_9PROT